MFVQYNHMELVQNIDLEQELMALTELMTGFEELPKLFEGKIASELDDRIQGFYGIMSLKVEMEMYEEGKRSLEDLKEVGGMVEMESGCA